MERLRGKFQSVPVDEGIIGRWGSIDPTEGGKTSRTNLQMNYKHIISSSEQIDAMACIPRYNFNFIFRLYILPER